MIPEKYLLQTLFATLAFMFTTIFSLFNNTFYDTVVKALIAFFLFFFIGGFVRWLIEINIEPVLIKVNKKVPETKSQGLEMSLTDDDFLGSVVDSSVGDDFDFMTNLDDLNYDDINKEDMEFDPEQLARALREFSKD